jgi:uncharacterized membrane protein
MSGQDAREPLRPQEPPRPVERVEWLVSRMLRVGVSISMIILLLGVCSFFVHHPRDLFRSDVLDKLVSPQAQFPHTVTAVVRQLDHFQAPAVIAIGLLVLIATPVMRVAVSIIGFSLERDWVYVCLTVFVLLVLLASFWVGNTGE